MSQPAFQYDFRTFSFPSRPSSFTGSCLADRVAKIPVPGLRTVVISLREVRYLDSADVEVLRTLSESLRRRNIGLSLDDIPPGSDPQLRSGGLAHAISPTFAKAS